MKLQVHSNFLKSLLFWGFISGISLSSLKAQELQVNDDFTITQNDVPDSTQMFFDLSL